MKKGRKSNFTNIYLVLILLTGLSLLLYPTVSDYWNSFHQSRAITSYAETVAGLDSEKYDRMLNEAQAYNRSILINRENSYVLTDEERAIYNELLNISEVGIMGYVEIPSINCTLPIYHGTEESVLQIAIGHLEWTSLPVGGSSSHCVISGHRGLPSAKLFTDLDELSEGDIFMLRVLDEVLTYEVDQISIVLPTQVEELHISEGEDFCTLVTCTPYGINTHRLLVRGHRIENIDARTIRVTADAMQIDPVLVAPAVAMPMLLGLLLWLLIKYRKRK